MTEVFRFPPSPTGLFHIGSARTAYFNYLAARSCGGKLIMRIDDTDVERNKDEYIEIILDSMKWLGLDYDELYYQSKRTELYLSTAEELIANKLAKRLDNGAIALITDFWTKSSFHDTIAGEIAITDTNREQIKNTILVRGGEKQDQPTYQFCSVFDDYDMGVTHIMRGIDHLTNTAKQVCIWQSLQQTYSSYDIKPIPKFTHLGLIMKDKKKMSKRDGAASLLDYREKQYHPTAILNFILMLGWSLRVPRGDKELEKIANAPISKELAIELFQQGTLKSTPCSFDINKLNWLQKKYSK